ncbi:MAG: radical SAM protein [Candidatus Aminicenantes bacterium]|nr:radical SAM protein [Candidatus Aminicenantes bacterium]
MPITRNILLINPWIYDFTAYDFWLRPLGLLYVASILRKHTSFRLSFIDCLDRYHPLLPKKMKAKADGRGPFPKEEVVKPVILKNVPRKYSRYGIPVSLFLQELSQVSPPDLVLITSTMTYWYPGVQLAAKLVRQKFGRVPVVLGGIYATLMPRHAQSSTEADFVVQGPGEKKLFSVIKEALGDGSIPEIQIDSFGDVPWPALDMLRNKRDLPILASRGCPSRCSFCAASLLYSHFEQRKPDSVADEMEYHHRQLQARNFAFYDDALLLNKRNHVIPLLKDIIKRKLPLSFHTPNGLHIREINFELAALFKKANFRSLYLSQESFEERILAKASAKVSAEDLKEALENLEKVGYHRNDINVYLMTGLPEQEISGIQESVRQVQQLGAKPHLAYFSPVPGTAEWNKLVEKGIFAKDADPLLHNKLTFPYLWGNFSPEDFESLSRLLKKERA